MSDTLSHPDALTTMTGVSLPVVRESESGWSVVIGDETVAAASTLREALDTTLPFLPLHEPHLRESGVDVGEFRWLDASSVERSQDHPGGYFDALSLHEMASSLNASEMPVPVDGGVAPDLTHSEVHGTAVDSGTPANGWAHGAVIVERKDGPHLYLRAELWPSIATEVDRGRIAYGSVYAATPERSEEGAFRGCELLGHALTNTPANRRLTPSTAQRARAETVRTRSPAMSTKKTEPAETKRADAPVEEPIMTEADPAAPEDKDAMIASLQEENAALKAQLEAMTAEVAASRETMPDPEAVKAEEAARAEKLVEETVERAIKDGVVLRSTAEHWKVVVRRSGVEGFAALTKGLRALPKRQAAAGESSIATAHIDENDPAVRAMRAMGVTDKTIARQMVERTKEI